MSKMSKMFKKVKKMPKNVKKSQVVKMKLEEQDKAGGGRGNWVGGGLRERRGGKGGRKGGRGRGRRKGGKGGWSLAGGGIDTENLLKTKEIVTVTKTSLLVYYNKGSDRQAEAYVICHF